MEFDMTSCTLCPRECKKDRTKGTGYCGESAEMRVAKIMLYRWEEPCISGNDRDRGSGAVFFSGCPLHCIYCQNRDISSGDKGEFYSPERLADAMKLLEEKGAYNINFVTPTHFTHGIIASLEIYRPSIPTVFNTSGYEKADTLEALRGYADIFLADLKYGGEELARHYSNAPDYLSVALSAIEKMIDITGPCQFFDDGMMKKGVIVRHLVLPGGRRDSVNALKALKDAVGTENILLSLMSQYTPDFAPEDCKPLSRRVTTFEYEFVRDAALDLGFEGFGQDKNSATKIYTPDF